MSGIQRIYANIGKQIKETLLQAKYIGCLPNRKNLVFSPQIKYTFLYEILIYRGKTEPHA